MVHMAQAAAAKLDGEGISCEIVDPRTTSPLDVETILESVENTGRLVVVDEANPRCRIATDIVGAGGAGGLRRLKAAPRMVTPPHSAGALHARARGRSTSRRPKRSPPPSARWPAAARRHDATAIAEARHAQVGPVDDGGPRRRVARRRGRRGRRRRRGGRGRDRQDHRRRREPGGRRAAPARGRRPATRSPVGGAARRGGRRRGRATRRSTPSSPSSRRRSSAGEADEDAGPAPETVDVGGRDACATCARATAATRCCSCTASAATSTTGSSRRRRWPRATPSTRSSCPATAARRRTSGPATSTSSSMPCSSSSTASSSSACTSSATRSAALVGGERRCATRPRARRSTLVARAGLGEEINGDYLDGFIAASRRRELKPALELLFADSGAGDAPGRRRRPEVQAHRRRRRPPCARSPGTSSATGASTCSSPIGWPSSACRCSSCGARRTRSSRRARAPRPRGRRGARPRGQRPLAAHGGRGRRQPRDGALPGRRVR